MLFLKEKYFMKNITLSGDGLANNLLILKKEHTGINYVTFFELVKFSYDVEKYLQKNSIFKQERFLAM